MAEQKIIVNSRLLHNLRKTFKDEFNKKAKWEDPGDEESVGLINRLRKNYEQTIELALRENVVVDESKSSSIKSKRDVETIDKVRAQEVNDLCATTEDLVRSTIHKRKTYPKEIKRCLKLQHDTYISNLKCLEENLHEDLTCNNPEIKLDLTDCKKYLTAITCAHEDLSKLSNELSEKGEKWERLNSVATMKSRMENSELDRVLFSKRKLPTTFDSILETPTKEIKLDNCSKNCDNVLSNRWAKQENERFEK